MEGAWPRSPGTTSAGPVTMGCWMDCDAVVAVSASDSSEGLIF